MPHRAKVFKFTSDFYTIWDSQQPRATMNLPSDVLDIRKKRKFYNFAYSKFDIKLKFLVSAPKTTSGIFWICYSPYEKDLQEKYQITNRDPAGITQYPGVKLNLAESTSAELIIPFVDYREAYNILSDMEDNVQVQFYLLAPLRNITTLSGEVTMTVEASLCNVSITCPTPSVPVQGGIWYSQGFSENGRKGVISEVSGVVSQVSNVLSNVPVIGAIAKPVNMISNLVGGVASLLGFSKPITFEQQQNVTNLPGRGYAHCKGIDNSTMLGFSQETELGSISSEFPSKEDEMDIESILRTPGIAFRREWNANTEFTGYTMPFKILWEPVSTPGFQKIENCSYFEYLSSMFKYVRSDIVYTFEISKTAFHAGKLEIFFSPGTTSSLPTTTDASTSYRVVWDISESNKLEFKIPYTYNKAFYETSDNTYGTLTFREILPLQYNEGVEDTVDIIVWRHYENTKFMCPVFADYLLFDITKTENDEAPKWNSQVKVEEEAKSTSVTALLSKQRAESVLTQVGGETVVNLRYLTRSHRPTELNNLVAMQPIYLNFYGSNNLIETDMLTYFSYMYRMMRGGIRYKIFTNSGSGKVFSALADDIRPGLISHTTYNSLNPVHEVEIPYYNKNRRYILGLVTPKDVPQGISVVSTQDDSDVIITQAGSDDFSFGLRVGPPRIFRVTPVIKERQAYERRPLQIKS